MRPLHRNVPAAGDEEEKAVLPNCDPAHFQKILTEVQGDENAALEKILSGGSYPKRVLPREKQTLKDNASTAASSSAAEGEECDASPAGACPQCGKKDMDTTAKF